jgi:hypothetical protein
VAPHAPLLPPAPPLTRGTQLAGRRRPRRLQVAQRLSAFGGRLRGRQLELNNDSARATMMLSALAHALDDDPVAGAAGGAGGGPLGAGRRAELMSGPLGPPLARLAQLLGDGSLKLAPGVHRYSVALLQVRARASSGGLRAAWMDGALLQLTAALIALRAAASRCCLLACLAAEQGGGAGALAGLTTCTAPTCWAACVAHAVGRRPERRHERRMHVRQWATAGGRGLIAAAMCICMATAAAAAAGTTKLARLPAPPRPPLRLQAGALAGKVPSHVWRSAWAQMLGQGLDMAEEGEGQGAAEEEGEAEGQRVAAAAAAGRQGLGRGGAGAAGQEQGKGQGDPAAGGRVCERCGATTAQVWGCGAATGESRRLLPANCELARRVPPPPGPGAQRRVPQPPCWARGGGSQGRRLAWPQVEARGGSLHRCLGCSFVWYCGKEFQKAAWRAGHRQRCKELAMGGGGGGGAGGGEV